MNAAKRKALAERSKAADTPTERKARKLEAEMRAARKAKPTAEVKTRDGHKHLDGAIVNAWKAGTTIAQLVKDHPMSRSQMRKILISGVGGKDAFRTLRAQGAGGKAEPFGGKRRAPRATGETPAPAIDDSDVPFTADTSKSAGWSVDAIASKRLGVLVHIDPEGIAFVQASAHERADLIRLSPTEGIPNTRLRRLDTSGKAKAAKREAKLVERGERALKATRAKKRAARKARKGGSR